MATTKSTTTKKKTTTTKATLTKATETVSAPVEEKVIAQVAAKPVMTRYKFIANCNNLNVSNIIFNNIKVVIYEVDAPNYDSAFDSFQESVMKMFNGDAAKYNTFMAAVFGDDILVESVKVDQINQNIAYIH